MLNQRRILQRRLPEYRYNRPHECQIKPLHQAASKGYAHCVKQILESGADPNEKLICCNCTPLDFAIRFSNGSIESNIDMITNLIEKGAKITVKCSDKVFEYLRCFQNLQLNMDFYANLLKCAIISQEFYNMKEYKCIEVFQSILFCAFQLNNFTMAKYVLLNSEKPTYHIGFEGTGKHYSIPFYCLHMEPFRFTFILTKLRLLKEFGSNFWVNEYISINNYIEETCMLKYLHTYPRMSFVPRKDVKQIEEMIKNPLNLQKLCRLSIKQEMGFNYMKNINALPLPKTILDFLCFNDVVVPSYSH